MLQLGKLQLALAAALVIGFVLVRKNMTEAAAGVTGALIGGAGDLAAGTVIGIGDVLGLPRTNESECQKAMREGRTWDASFACPASTFLDYTINGYIDTNNRGLE